jgi:glycerol-3-phosphate dehydrogenase (NAD(P)+)
MKAGQMKTAAILGAGVMGTAVAWPLTDNGYDVHLIGTHLDEEIIRSCKDDRFHPKLKRRIPEKVTPFRIDELERGLDGAEFIVSGVNSNGVHWIGETLKPYVKPGDQIIGITKGLEADAEGNLIILPEVMRLEFSPEMRDSISMAAIGGPCIAGELAGRRQSCVYFGAHEIGTARHLAEVFKTDYYHTWITDDLEGLELAVALKNAYALGVGIATGALEQSGGVDSAGAYMHNLAAALFARSCIEIHTFLEIRNLNTKLAYGLPGAGDLYVTCQGGRSVTIGKLLGMGKTFKEASHILAGETLEAALVIQQVGNALPILYKKGVVEKSQFPLMEMLIDIVVNEQSIHIDLDTFFNDIL